MIRNEIRETLRLAIPVVLTHVGAISMSIADTIMVGRLGPEPLSAVALGNSFSFTTLIVGMGVIMALDPIVSQAFGGKRFLECGSALLHGFFVAIIMTIPIMLFLNHSGFFFSLLRQSTTLSDQAADYVSHIKWSVLPFLLYAALRQFMQGISRARPALYVVILSNVINLFFNWMFIYGHLGVPAMGSSGAAISTSIGRWAMFFMLFIYVYSRRDLQEFKISQWPRKLNFALLRRIFRLGLPVGTQYGLEIGVFASTSIMMGWLGTLALAGHQIALNLCSTSYMVPLGLSSTAAVRVGQALGRHDVPGARRAASISYVMGLGFMAVAALCFFAFTEFWVSIYTSDPALLQMGASLLLIGAAFQISDGTQAIAIGVLRGAGDTRVPMFAAMLCYWGVGLPLGYVLAFKLGMGPRGLWYGLTTGLTLVGITMTLRFYHRVKSQRLNELQA